MGVSGKKVVAEALERFRASLYEYFGAINEFEEGLIKEIPEKPEILQLYDQTKSLGIPLCAGGVLDQPHMWVKLYRICEEVMAVMNIAKKNQEEAAKNNKTR